MYSTIATVLKVKLLVSNLTSDAALHILSEVVMQWNSFSIWLLCMELVCGMWSVMCERERAYSLLLYGPWYFHQLLTMDNRPTIMPELC